MNDTQKKNMDLYNAVRVAPDNALKTITAGRLKGMTDINPMWRIQQLTEQFGPAGIGWYYTITNQWLEPGANGEICAFTNIELFVKFDGEWSAPIEGTGGSMLVAKESKGMFTSDEAFKKSLTDAISVACKALGFAADIYWNKGADSKYPTQPMTENKNLDPITNKPIPQYATEEQLLKINDLVVKIAKASLRPEDEIFDNIEKRYGDMTKLSPIDATKICGQLAKQLSGLIAER